MASIFTESQEGYRRRNSYLRGDAFKREITQLLETSKSVEMLSGVFGAGGRLCARRPWEVIVITLTLTVCIVSSSMYVTANRICGYNYKCSYLDVDKFTDVKSSDVIVLTIIRCIAVIYIYLQFGNLRKLGSKYLLGMAGLATIFFSFVISIAAINMISDDLTGLKPYLLIQRLYLMKYSTEKFMGVESAHIEALPFFLLLVDLSKASTLTSFALSDSQGEVSDKISRGLAVIGPSMLLDAIVQVLVIGVGTLSGVRQLETMCLFGCLSVVANYLALITFFPACLAVVLQWSREREASSSSTWQLHQVAKVLHEEEEDKPNPAAQVVKLVVSIGLVIVHAHSRFVSAQEAQNADAAAAAEGELTRYLTPTMPLWQFLIAKCYPPTVDYVVTSVLAVILGLKYALYDTDSDDLKMAPTNSQQPSAPSLQQQQEATPTPQQQQQQQQAVQSNLDSAEGSKQDLPVKYTTKNTRRVSDVKRKPVFTVGDDSDSDSDDSDKQKKQTSLISAGTQTDERIVTTEYKPLVHNGMQQRHSIQQCIAIMKSDAGPGVLSDEEILMLVKGKHLPAYKLEGMLSNHERGVSVRRQLISQSLPSGDALTNLPYTNYDYKYVEGACCENVLGYMPVPVGVAGPLLMNSKQYHVPMATTEGCLVASTNRGCRAISASGGGKAFVIGSGMTRAPVVRFPSAEEAAATKKWLSDQDNFDLVAEAFNSTTRFGRLLRLHVVQAARLLYIRFIAHTGDAMGMNMLSKGSEKALAEIQEHFPTMEIMALSGNFCTDKKPAAINWVEGRGKSVVCEAVIPANIVKTVLKTTVSSLVDLNISKNLMGSAMAGSIGGFNAHAANIVTAIYIATGQDPAQNVASSSCMTVMEASGADGEDLYISCTMPSIEVGTVGGGTVLPPQAACLKMLGVHGSNREVPGAHAEELAMVVCSAVMAGELSLMSALAAGHLVKSHLKHNRSSLNIGGQKSASDLKEPGTCIQKAA